VGSGLGKWGNAFPPVADKLQAEVAGSIPAIGSKKLGPGGRVLAIFFPS